MENVKRKTTKLREDWTAATHVSQSGSFGPVSRRCPKIHTEQEIILKEELKGRRNPCVATGIFRTYTYRNFSRFHSVIRNPCKLLLICVLLPGVCVVTN